MFQKKLRGPQILSNLLPEEAKKMLKSRGFSELELLANWERIVGKKFAKLTIPLRLKIGKSSEKNNGKLIVKVDRSVAFAFEHEREKIIKKINLFFGYEVINKVEIIMRSVGIIGFGRFGKILASILQKGYSISAYDLKETHSTSNVNFCSLDRVLDERVVFIAVPIRNFKTLIKEFSLNIFVI